jgi:hypothetical protein
MPDGISDKQKCQIAPKLLCSTFYLFDLLVHTSSHGVGIHVSVVTSLLKMMSHHAGFVLLQGPYRRVHDSSESNTVSRTFTKNAVFSLSLSLSLSVLYNVPFDSYIATTLLEDDCILLTPYSDCSLMD